MDYKNIDAARTTITREIDDIKGDTDNLYKSIVILSKRSTQINSDLKQKLWEKLNEFATHSDAIQEVFENAEQIEVSRFFEQLPKPTAIAIEEWLRKELYYRNPEDEENQKEDNSKTEK
tara:strand:- start:2 stop:358 length:357 start_codon:yes stop_codon:yes gene_type:complete